MNDKKLIQIMLVPVIMSSSFLIGATAVTFFTKQVDSTITVVDNGYAVTLYSDANLTSEITTLGFSQLMVGITDYSDWVEVYVKFDTNPENQIWGHISTTNVPSGLVLTGQTYRFLTEVWGDIDIDDDTCDFGNDAEDDSYVPKLRFRVERTDSATGSFTFQTVFTIMDSTTL